MTEKFLQRNYRYYKVEAHFLCPDCSAYHGRFTYMSFTRDTIKFAFNSECGFSWARTMSYKKFLKLYIECMSAKDVELYYYVDLFTLGLDFREVFQYSSERVKYGDWLERIRLSTNSGLLFQWRKIWKKNKLKKQ